MATCAAYNCESLGTFDSTLEQCTTYRKGGVSSVVLIGCGQTLADPTDETEVQDLIDGGNAWLLENVKVGLDAPSQETQDPVTACGSPIVINNVYTGTLFAAQVNANNTEFINKLIGGYVVGGMIMKVCDTAGLTDIQVYVDAEISFAGGLVVPNTNSEYIRYEVTFTFKSNDLAVQNANPIFG